MVQLKPDLLAVGTEASGVFSQLLGFFTKAVSFLHDRSVFVRVDHV
jgi:hypothetical protein